MKTHELKTWTNAWEAVRDGRKRFEWRRDDRGFEVGDVLELVSINPKDNSYPNNDERGFGKREVLRVRVTYILRGLFDVPPGYCVMSIEPEAPK